MDNGDQESSLVVGNGAYEFTFDGRGRCTGCNCGGRSIPLNKLAQAGVLAATELREARQEIKSLKWAITEILSSRETQTKHDRGRYVDVAFPKFHLKDTYDLFDEDEASTGENNG